MQIVDGDLLLAKEKYICHQCNCVSKKAAHLAKAVFETFPYANVYSHRLFNDWPGTIRIMGDGKGQREVVALFAQVYPGKPRYESGPDCASARESYFRDCLEKLGELCWVDKHTVAFPYGIGCGAAGGNWDNYLVMIETFSARHNLDVTIYCKDGGK